MRMKYLVLNLLFISLIIEKHQNLKKLIFILKLLNFKRIKKYFLIKLILKGLQDFIFQNFLLNNRNSMMKEK